MIAIRRDGTRVRVSIETDLPNKDEGKTTCWWLSWDCGRTEYAQLLSSYFAKRLNDRLAAIRRAAYDAGWKDAKSKRTGKRMKLFGSWDPHNIGH